MVIMSEQEDVETSQPSGGTGDKVGAEGFDEVTEDSPTTVVEEAVDRVGSGDAERHRRIESSMFKNRRHYKKDSRFVTDLYTLTFDEDESVGSLDQNRRDHRAPASGQVPSSLKENASYISAKNNNHDFSSWEDYLKDGSASLDGGGEADCARQFFSRDSRPDVRPGESKREEYQDRSSTSIPTTGPTSLPHQSPETTEAKMLQRRQPTTPMKTLETNLHKILARKFADTSSAASSGEEVAFEKAKLLTKAYYQLLRDDDTEASKATVRSSERQFVSAEAEPVVPVRGCGREDWKGGKATDDRLRWSVLIAADHQELKRMVSGLGNSAQALNDYLVALLMEKDESVTKQDEMLEQISQLAENLLK